MLIVEIYVNNTFIARETAQRIKGGMRPDDINTYMLSDGETIKHRYGDGAARLAEKMMKKLKKKGV